MKCPDCGKRLPDNSWFTRNLFLVVVGGGVLLSFLPFDTEHGYRINYDMAASLIISFIWFVYLKLYDFGKVKGRFLIWKKDD